jgi:hypothetical protein
MSDFPASPFLIIQPVDILAGRGKVGQSTSVRSVEPLIERFGSLAFQTAHAYRCLPGDLAGLILLFLP